MRQPLVALVVLTACASPVRFTDPPPPPEVVVEFEATPPPPVVVARGSGEEVATLPTREQPPEVKLRLGHYVSDARGIGVTIDRTSELAKNRPPVAKLRYDGTEAIQVLEPLPGSGRRTDYLSRRKVVLHVYSDGKVEIYVDSDGPIALRRDADADPL